MRRVRLLAALAIVAGALIYLLIGGIRGAVVYYVTPSELLARGAAAHSELRLGGQVAAGSRQWNAATLDLHFVLTDGSASIPVRYHGAPPDLFREGQGAIVEGRYAPEGTFIARSIIVKHSEEYKPPDSGGQ